MVRVKICGITNLKDALLAAELGADALGFIFAESPRRIDPKAARAIINELPPFVQRVGVFADEALETVKEIIRFCGLDWVQLHGNEPPDFCGALMPRAVKGFRLKGPESLVPITDYRGQIKAQLLDTYQEGIKGGTGRTFDWGLAIEAGRIGIPVILSGGLTPANIEKGIRTVHPAAVDVNSGIESQPGQKDPALMRRLMKTIKMLNKETA